MDTGFFVSAKLVTLFLQVETWLVVGMTISVLAGVARRRRLSVAAGTTTLAALLVLGTVPLGEMLLRPLEAEYPQPILPERIDGIVVLGGVEDVRATAAWGQPQINEAAERLTVAAALALQHPQARIVFSGGSGQDFGGAPGSASFPDVAGAFFASFGIAPGRISWENLSRNTAENARLSLARAQPREGEVWLLITSAFHMGRAMRSFHAAGWRDLVALPTDYRTGAVWDAVGWDFSGNIPRLNLAIKEHVGRIAYHLFRR